MKDKREHLRENPNLHKRQISKNKIAAIMLMRSIMTSNLSIPSMTESNLTIQFHMYINLKDDGNDG